MRILALVLIPWLAHAQAGPYPCEPSKESAIVTEKIVEFREEASNDVAHRDTRKLLSDFLREHPNDIFGNLENLREHHERYNNAVAQYQAALAQHPTDPLYELYAASSLIGSDTPEAIRRLRALETTHPELPYTDLLLAEIHRFPKFYDRTEVAKHIYRFVDRCPGYLPAYEYIRTLPENDDLSKAAKSLRQHLVGRTDRIALQSYPLLWSVEFRITRPENHDALRARVVEDLKLIGQPGGSRNETLVKALREGYRLTSNTEAAKALSSPQRPGSPLFEDYDRWIKSNPYPKSNASISESHAHQAALAKACEVWIRLWPEEPMPYSFRFRALAALPETSEADLIKAGDALLAINRKRPGVFLTTPALITVALEYAKRGIRLDDIPGMVQKGLDESRIPRVPEYDFFDDRNAKLNAEARNYAQQTAHMALFEWAMRTNRADDARKAIAKLRETIDAGQALSGQKTPNWGMDKVYWECMTRLAELEHNEANAAKYRELASNSVPKEVRTAPSSLGWEPRNQKLAEFHLNDLSGKTWHSSELIGKVLIISVWATWCPPCIEELPEFQRLYEQTKSRSDVIALSLNMDYNPGDVQPYLKKTPYTFPVLLGFSYIEGTLPEWSIPRTWIIDAQGILRHEQIGYNKQGNWLEGTLTKANQLVTPAKPTH